MAGSPSAAQTTSADDEENRVSTPADERDTENQSQQNNAQQAPQESQPEQAPLEVAPLGRQAPFQEAPPDDAEARHEQVRQQVRNQASAQFGKEHPFLPSGWAPPPSEQEEGSAIRQSDIETQSQLVQQRQERMQQVRAQNASARAQSEATGQRMVEDENGQLQPLTEPQTGAPLYTRTGWEMGKNPRTGDPAMTMRDEHGQRQFKSLPVVHNDADLSDQNGYYKSPTGELIPTGKSLDDLTQHSDLNVRMGALKARKQRDAEVWKEAIAPINDAVGQAKYNVENAKSQSLALQTQIDDLSNRLAQTQDPTQAQALQANLDQVQAQQQQFSDAVKPGTGSLYRIQAQAELHQGMMTAAMKQKLFNHQIAERMEFLKANKLPTEGDPVLEANQQAIEGISSALGEGARTAQLRAQSGWPDGVPGVKAIPQGEPEQVAQQGITHIGNEPVERIAQAYGYGKNALNPYGLLRMNERINTIGNTLSSNGDTLSKPVQDSLQEEQTYLKQLYAQRIARMPQEDRQKLQDAIAHQTTSAGGAFGRAAGEQLAPTAAMVAGGEAGAAAGVAGSAWAGLPTEGAAPAVAGVLGGLIGGMGAYWGASKAQKYAFSKLFPNASKEFDRYTYTDWQQHPFAVTAGNVVPMAASMGFASPAQMRPGVEGLLKLAKGEATTEAERVAAGQLGQHLGTQVGFGATVGALDPLLHGQKPTVGGVAQNIIQALVFGKVEHPAEGAERGEAARPEEPPPKEGATAQANEPQRPPEIPKAHWDKMSPDLKAEFAAKLSEEAPKTEQGATPAPISNENAAKATEQPANANPEGQAIPKPVEGAGNAGNQLPAEAGTQPAPAAAIAAGAPAAPATAPEVAGGTAENKAADAAESKGAKEIPIEQQPKPPELKDQPVKLEVTRGKSGDKVEIEMTAEKAHKMMTDRIATLNRVIDCIGGSLT